MLDKSAVYNVLAEGMYFLDKYIPSYFNILDFTHFFEVFQIPYVIF